MSCEYILKPVSEKCTDDECDVFEVRHDGRIRKVSRGHHGYVDFVAKDGWAEREEFVKEAVKPKMTTDTARNIAVHEMLQDYLLILARWDGFTETTKTEALAEWRVALDKRVDELMPEEIAEIAISK